MQRRKLGTLSLGKFAILIPPMITVPEDMLNYASKHGVAKINIDTDLRLAMTSTIREFFVEHPEKFDPREYMGPGRTAVKEMVMHKMRDVLGTAGHADDECYARRHWGGCLGNITG